MDKIYKGRIGGEIEQYTPPATSDTHPAQWGQVKTYVAGGVSNPTQTALTDAATLSWNLGNNPLAILTATSGVGAIRTLPNSVITSGTNGINYQLTFIGTDQTIVFDSNYRVTGEFNPSGRTLITIVVQGVEADVIVSPITEVEKPEALTGTNFNLSKYEGNTYNFGAASSATAYTWENPVVLGYAIGLINAASEPTVSGATKIAGNAFEAGVNMEIVVRSMDGVNVEYYFMKR